MNTLDITRCDLWDRLKDESRPLIIYGMGNGADKLIRALDRHEIAFADIFASDDFVRGQSFHGIRVKTLSEIKKQYDEFVILLAFATSRREVLDRLYHMDTEYNLLMPDLPVVGDVIWDRAFEAEHTAEISAARVLFADQQSMALYDSIIAYRRSGRIGYLRQAVSDPSRYIPYSTVHVYVDVGAYHGETVCEVASRAPSLRLAIAIEPDVRNFRRLNAFALEPHTYHIETLMAAAYDSDGTQLFHDSGNRNSSIDGASYQHTDRTVHTVRIDSLDDCRDADFIKYDVEGAETAALIGSDDVILSAHPVLSVSVYHRPEDLFALPLLIHDRYPEYRLYLARAESLPAFDLTLIAVPPDMAKHAMI